MSKPNQIVMALDDDPAVLASLENLLTAHGHAVRMHADAESFFSAGLPDGPSCLLLDHRLGSGLTGFEVHAELQERGWLLPTIFLTAHWDAESVVRAMRAGADGFLTKPYDPEHLLEEIDRALARSEALQQTGKEAAELAVRAASLTKRERKIVELVVSGMLNKEIAAHLNLALVTVKVYRGRAMKKMQAGNAAELAHLAFLAGIVTGS